MQSVTVTNSGDASLFINSAAVGGADRLDFTAVNDGCSGLTLAPGISCSMSITFSPTTSGTRSATLSVTDNVAGSPQTVPLTGTGSGTPPPLAIDTQFFTCSGGVCDIGAGSNVFVNNFFTTGPEAPGQTSDSAATIATAWRGRRRFTRRPCQTGRGNGVPTPDGLAQSDQRRNTPTLEIVVVEIAMPSGTFSASPLDNQKTSSLTTVEKMPLSTFTVSGADQARKVPGAGVGPAEPSGCVGPAGIPLGAWQCRRVAHVQARGHVKRRSEAFAWTRSGM
jgi:hypothetical protein